jgi:hypothetical protein
MKTLKKKCFSWITMSVNMSIADEVKKYADPLDAESDGFMPEAVKLQLLLSKEEDMKEALNHFQKMNLLKPVLDSQAIQSISSKMKMKMIL